MTVRLTEFDRPKKPTYARFQINDFHRDVIAQLCDFIRSNVAGDLSMDRLAAKSGYSKSHLLKMFRMIHGYSLHQYVKNVRLDAAARLLRDTDLYVFEIRERVGFGSSGAFAERFAARFGTTPVKYRAHVRAQAWARSRQTGAQTA